MTDKTEFNLAPGEELTEDKAKTAGVGDLVGIIASGTTLLIQAGFAKSLLEGIARGLSQPLQEALPPEDIGKLKRSIDVAGVELNRRFEQAAKPEGEGGR